MRNGPKLVLHITPLSSFYPQGLLDVQEVVGTNRGFLPFDTPSPYGRYNIDGHVSY